MATHQIDLLSLLFDTPAEVAPQPAPVALKPTRRHFYRCADCLTVAASEVKTAYHAEGYAAPKHGKCGACGGELEYMGEVQRDRLVKHGLETPCDDRCTNARGPCCDCKCGGANHGSDLLVPVTYDCGGVPRLEVADGKAKIRGQYYRELCAEFRQVWNGRYGRVTDRKRDGHYLDGAEYRMYRDGGRMLEQVPRDPRRARARPEG